MNGSQDGYSEMSWYPDSGASSHVTYDLNNLNTAADFQGSERLQVGNGTGLPILHVGESVVKFDSSPPDHVYILKSLLHVPHIRKNLLSVSQFAKDNQVFFEFHPNYCLVKDQVSGQTLLTGKLEHGLYKFSLKSSSSSSQKSNTTLPLQYSTTTTPSVFASSLKKEDPLSLWHFRPGHSAFDNVKRALKSCSISYFVDDSNRPCIPCLQGKCHKLYFGTSASEHGLFELIHSDL